MTITTNSPKGIAGAASTVVEILAGKRQEFLAGRSREVALLQLPIELYMLYHGTGASITNERAMAFVRDMATKYQCIYVGTSPAVRTGEEAAAWLMDASNMHEIGHEGRSMSTSDIALVDGVPYVCLPYGWGIIK